MEKILKMIICIVLISTMVASSLTAGVCAGSDHSNSRLNMNELRSSIKHRINTLRNSYPIPEKRTTPGRGVSDWSPSELVSTESTGNSTWSSIATDASDNVYVVWEDDTNYSGCGTDWDIFFKMKPHGGSWTMTEVVSTDSTIDSSMSAIAVEPDGTVHVTWDEYGQNSSDVYYRTRSPDGVWSTSECISLQSCNQSGLSSIYVDGDGTVHVALCGVDLDGNTYIYYKMKPAGGSWSTEELVTFDSQGHPYSPSIAMDSTKALHVAWMETDPTNYYGNIFYKMKPNGGNWTNAVQVSNCGIMGLYPSLTVDLADNIHITWSDLSTSYLLDINYRMKSAGGDWSDIQTLSSNSYALMSHIKASPDGSVSVVFDEFGTMYFEVHYRNKPQGGDWSPTEVVTDDFNSDAMLSSLAINSTGYAQVTWEDMDYSGIYYKNNNNLNLPPASPPAPDGPATGYVDHTYSFSTATTDPNEDMISYFFDWGDGTTSGWIGPYASGATATTTHSWSGAGDYLVKVKAKDDNGAVTDWSPTHAITIKAMPVLTFGSFKGGRGLKTTLINEGNGTATNITWNIAIKGAIVFHGSNSSGTIPSLEPGESVTLSTTVAFFGFGKIAFKATAVCDEGASCSREGTGFLLFVFIVGVK